MCGQEWVVEAHGADPAALADLDRLRRLLARMIADLDLHPVSKPVWRQFPGGGGITGLCLLAESHFACHTFPEYGAMCLNLFCCKPRPDWDFHNNLRHDFGATSVRVRRIERPYAPEP
jgi:S-adenosylmethionine decarboxylase